MSRQYCVNLRNETGWVPIPKRDFDRLRRFPVFELRSKGTRLRLKADYVAWRTEDGEMHFQEKLTKRITRYVPSPEDSCVATERRCAVHDRRYIRDDVRRQREIERQYS